MKKITSVLLSFILIFSSVFTALPVFANSIELEDGDYQRAGEVLRLICPDFPLRDSELTTRAEFTAAVSKLINVNAAKATEAPFMDVGLDNIYVSDIAYAKLMGLVSSVDLFYPDTHVSYAQAVKILMTAIGYGKKAEYSGGYPTGYLMLANNIGLGMGLKLDKDAKLTHAQATELIFEAVCADMMEVVSYGESQDYSVTEGKNILSVYHKIYCAEGLVASNEFTGLYSTTNTAGKNNIGIGNKKFNGVGYEGLIGRNSRVFYKNDGKNSIISAYAIENDEYSFTADDSLSLSGLTLTAIPLDKKKNVSYNLDGDWAVIYNGKYLSAPDYAPYLAPEAGTVTLINNDTDSEIDLVIVNEIEYGIVGNINVFDEKIYDKYRKNGFFDLSKSDYYTVCESDGSPISIEDLEAGNILGYVKSDDDALVHITRYSQKAGGIFDSLTSDGKICIGDKEYVLSSYYKNNVKDLSQLKLGGEVIVHLGAQNQVIYIEEFTRGMSYGYVIDVGNSTETTFGGKTIVKLLCQDGSVEVLDLAKKPKINGESKTSAQAHSFLMDLNAKSAIYKVIKYTLNSEGELFSIYDTVMNDKGIAVLTGENVDEANPVLFDDNTKYVQSGGTITHKLFFKNGVFYPYFKAADNAIVMQVPPDGSPNIGDEKYYTLSTMTKLNAAAVAGSGTESMECYGYDVDRNGAAFILWALNGGSETVGSGTASGVVESVTDGLNPDGERVKIIKMYHNKGWQKYYSKPAHEYPLTLGVSATLNAINAMQPGDVVRVDVNSENEITAATIDFTYATKTIEGDESNKTIGIQGKQAGFISGYIYSYASGIAFIVSNMTIEDIDRNAASLDIKNLYPANLNRGTTVFVKLIRDRQTNAVESANVYTELDHSTIEDFYTSGLNADYVVQRAYYHDVSITFVYVN